MTIFIASRFRTTAILKKNENKNFSVFPENCLEGEKEAINDDDKKWVKVVLEFSHYFKVKAGFYVFCIAWLY